jgi:hypothetical protein
MAGCTPKVEIRVRIRIRMSITRLHPTKRVQVSPSQVTLGRSKQAELELPACQASPEWRETGRVAGRYSLDSPRRAPYGKLLPRHLVQRDQLTALVTSYWIPIRIHANQEKKQRIILRIERSKCDEVGLLNKCSKSAPLTRDERASKSAGGRRVLILRGSPTPVGN